MNPADVVILAIGVRPETALAKAAGLEIGQRGGIRVDEHMTTSDPDILAVGDAVEVKDYVTGQWTLIPLAGPAKRQSRIAADVIADRDSRYGGTQGTSICKIFEGEIGQTGPSEEILRQLGDTDVEKLHLYQNSHAGYHPGARVMPAETSRGTSARVTPWSRLLEPLRSTPSPWPWSAGRRAGRAVARDRGIARLIAQAPAPARWFVLDAAAMVAGTKRAPVNPARPRCLRASRPRASDP